MPYKTRDLTAASLSREEMLDLRIEGNSFQRIADEAGITRQAVSLILTPPVDVRDSIYQRHDDRCAHCGLRCITRTEDTTKNISGHLHNTRGGDLNWNTPETLILLCASCHRIEHMEK